MSFLNPFSKKTKTAEQAQTTDAEVVSQPATDQATTQPEPTPVEATEQIQQPQQPQQEVAAATETSTPATEQATVEVTPEPATPAVQHIETVPLGKDEINSLTRSGYERIKDRFTKTFVIEKYFWARMQVAEGPDGPANKLVKVKRLAEIKAGNLMHALKLIGWDSKNVSVVMVKDEYDGGIAIKIDGKTVSSIKVDGAAYPSLTGSQKRAFVATVKDMAIKDEKIQAVLNDPKKPRKVVGHAYEHAQHINLETSKVKVVTAPAAVVVDSTEVVQVPEVPNTPSLTAEDVQVLAEDAQAQADSAQVSVL